MHTQGVQSSTTLKPCTAAVSCGGVVLLYMSYLSGNSTVRIHHIVVVYFDYSVIPSLSEQ